MQLKDAISTLSFRQKRGKLNVLYTRWGESVEKEARNPGYIPLKEYPRPQMRRKQYQILNGWWKYQIVKGRSWEIPQKKNIRGKILVPFSPESILSGANFQLKPGETLWYERTVSMSLRGHEEERMLLHFGAVDQECKVYWNGELAGEHLGGYLPFTMDVTRFVKEGKNLIQVACQDESDTGCHSRGKQKLEPGGMFYTAQSGIWQTVWTEWVPDFYIRNLRIMPDYDGSAVDLCIYPGGSRPGKAQPFWVEIYDQNQKICRHEAQISKDPVTVHLKIENFRKWSPEDPFLYDLRVGMGKDQVLSYFAMRLFSVEKDVKGVTRLCLNHRPYFLNGVLDQGYWPDGLYTAPTDEALRADIVRMKRLGFRMMRKHCKIEALRWYYHCDRIGMVVWQDMVNGGESYDMKRVCYLPTVFPKLTGRNGWSVSASGRKNLKGCQEWLEECKETIQVLYNCPSIGGWTIFNEGWGQFATEAVTRLVKKADSSRPVDSASGWYDCECGDIKSVHTYFDKLTCPVDKEVPGKNKRALAISEYGGLSLPLEEHRSSERVYGYKKLRSREELQKRYQHMQRQLKKLREEGLSAAVYTQVSDIEDEVNGIYTYDRKVCKLKTKDS